MRVFQNPNMRVKFQATGQENEKTLIKQYFEEEGRICIKSFLNFFKIEDYDL